eukprot:TRINITY_DN380_c0_g1_i3.p1 TRINITY_DN380_c0_g1~~TRINITY_DN380_c0_g1_i3.p1  ORF type:complete len:365 (-),score=56.13 TRINITY_DN380_c0_g1_i3:339-1433(-)
MKILLFTLILSLVLLSCCSIPDQAWDYVNVRPNAYMFWWLYGAENINRTESPLVMWLQGGPGGSSTGFGNFLELGPLDVDLKPRPFTWVKSANILFVDNPVGTGYSYVTNSGAYTTNEQQIGTDLVTLLQSFLQKYPTFKNSPFYIFCESYGGKMTASFGKALHQAIIGGKIQCNFKGVALGDSWIEPIAFVNTWGPYLLSLSEVDEIGYNKIMASAQACDQAVQAQNWMEATNLWGNVEDVVEQVTFNIDFYNIQTPRNVSQYRPKSYTLQQRALMHLKKYGLGDALDDLMNGPIKKKLGIIPSNVTWGGQAADVFQYLSVDFMQPVIETVNYLLENDILVVVYSGNLDLICCTPGTMEWFDI